MIKNRYYSIRSDVFAAGHEEEYTWAQNVQRADSPGALACETVWVICNSGMKYEIAQQIFERISKAVSEGKDPGTVFNNKNKLRAIRATLTLKMTRFNRFNELTETEEILDYFETFDGIGPITKYHLARNVGIDVCKPDRHLVRIAEKYDMTPEELCGNLAEKTGDRIGAVDVVLWRAAIMGII